MKLSELISSYAPIYPEGKSWDSTVEYISSDPIESVILQELIAQLKRDGKFREPIFLGIASEDDDSEFNAVLDGTHRTVASIIVGLDNVEVEFDKDIQAEEATTAVINEEPTEEFVIVGEFHFSDAESSLKGESDDELLFSLLRSFPVTDSLWAVSDMASGVGNQTSFYWCNIPPTIENSKLVEEKALTLLATQPTLMARLTGRKFFIEDLLADEVD